MLFDLIRGCDLTTISEIGWADWHRKEVDLDDFVPAFRPEAKPFGSEGKFTVRFSRPVQSESLSSDCFVMNVYVKRRERWLKQFRVPITGIENKPDEELVDSVEFIVDDKWFADAVADTNDTIFAERDEALVEIEVRGDYILDCNGQTVDANAVGIRAAPTGNGSPGGTFLSSFRVTNKSGDKNDD